METTRTRDQSTEILLAAFTATHDPGLRDVIIERHSDLVHSQARAYVRTGIPIADLVQCGWVALIGAVDRYDATRGARLTTYAIHCINGEIKRYFRDKTWGVKVPRKLREISSELPAVRERLSRSLNREPHITELSETFHVSEEVMLEAIVVGRGYQPIALDQERDQGDGGTLTIGDGLGCPDSNLDRIVEHAPLMSALATLCSRDESILRMRYLEGWSQHEVAVALGVSQMHISRLERAALLSVRQRMTPPAPLIEFEATARPGIRRPTPAGLRLPPDG